MKKAYFTFYLLLFVSTFVSSAYAQVSEQTIKQKRAELLRQRENMSSEEIEREYKAMNISRVPAKLDIAGAEKISAEDKTIKFSKKASNTLTSIPEDAIFPIESDEVQGILMTWSYTTKTVSGNQNATPLFDGWGIYGYSSTLVPVYSVPDVATNSSYAKLFGNLANAIQQHTQVWINVWYADDTLTIKNFMQERGTPLTNYRFFVHPGNAFWFRDFGPVAFYYGEDDEIGFLDLEYYGGRPLDNDIPVRIAEDLGFPVFTSIIEYEGGNVLVDGLGTLFTSTAVYESNMDSYGLYIQDPSTPSQVYEQEKTPLTTDQVDDSLRYLFNLSRLKVLPSLTYDGGTGHIDLYCDMWEETGFVVSQYPQSLSNWSDAQKVAKNLDTLLNMDDYFGCKYYASRIPLPAKNNGNYYSSQSEYNRDYTRSFSNHTFINDGIVQPVFYDSTAATTSKRGDIAGNLAALEILKQAYPGYTFEEVDVRSFDGFGGAIHCITKQIPAENPIRIYHQPIRYINTAQTQPWYATLNALVQNHSGIEVVRIYYRHAGESSFSELECDYLGDNMYMANIPLTQEVANDTISYFIMATSNNGKTITKPMTAPEGLYSFAYGTQVEGVVQNDVYGNGTNLWVSLEGVEENLDGIGEVYPNPAEDVATININNLKGDLRYSIINLKGQVLVSDKIKVGEQMLSIDVSALKQGNYWISFTDGNFSTVRKLVVVK